MSALTRWELGAFALSALLVLLSMIVLPVVRAVDPVLACGINFSGDATLQARFIGRSVDITHGGSVGTTLASRHELSRSRRR